MQVFEGVGNHTSNGSLSGVVTLTIPAGANAVRIQALTQNVRVRMDGSDPTSSVGYRITAGNDPVTIEGLQVGATVKVIEETSGGNIQYQYGHVSERVG